MHARYRVPVSTLSGGIALAFALSSPAIRAEDRIPKVSNNAQQEAKDQAREQGGLFVAPESPAFTLLGLSPTTVNRPTSAKGLGLTLATAVDSTGHVVQGFALEFVPPFLITGFEMDLAHYQASALTRALANTRISIGTAKTAGDSASTDAGFGFSMVLQDQGDPMRSRSFTDSLGDAMEQGLPDSPEDAADGIPPEVRKAARDLRSTWTRTHWNSRCTLFSAVTGLRFLSSEFGSSRGLGASTWLVHSEPMGGWGQFLLQVQYDYRREMPNTPRQQKLGYGARSNLGTGGYNAFLEFGGTSDLEYGHEPEGRWTGGLEFRIAEGVWASTGFGSGFGPNGSTDRVIVIANLRWAIADVARLSPK